MDVKLRSTQYPETSLEQKMLNKRDFPVSATCQSQSSSLAFLAVVGDVQTQVPHGTRCVALGSYLQTLGRWTMLLISVQMLFCNS